MNRIFLFAAGLLLALLIIDTREPTHAQEDDEPVPKVEVGAQFSSLSLGRIDFLESETEPGFGGRLTFNLSRSVALEAEGNFFPRQERAESARGGRALQGLFGVKAGKRFERFGVYGKVRPGFVHFTDAIKEITSTPVVLDGETFFFPELRTGGKTHFATDVGGVLELYHSQRILTRFDFGDTIIRYGERDTLGSVIIIGPDVQRPTIRLPSETKHNFQFTAGVGFRFRGGSEPGAQTSSGDPEGVRRFEAGVQFSSLLFDEPDRLSGAPQGFGSPPVNTESGFGGWFGVNFGEHVALEASGNFFPRESFPNETAGGYPSQFQAGVKAGRRWERWGLFAKARPGFVSFSRSLKVVGTETIVFNGETFTLPRFGPARRTYFSTDVGGVVEIYPSRRIITRFDFGDTVIRYGERETFGIVTQQGIPTLRAETKHNFQFTAGLGFRF